MTSYLTIVPLGILLIKFNIYNLCTAITGWNNILILSQNHD